MKKIAAVLATSVLFLLGSGTAAFATYNINEPMNVAGALVDPWIVDGSTVPTVVNVPGDTPENAMRLTDAVPDTNGFALFNKELASSRGIDITFHVAEWGGSGADGIVFFIKRGDNNVNLPGGLGGATGYSPNVVDGLAGALLGISVDGYGNFDGYDGQGCTNSFTKLDESNLIIVRGPGSGQDGYCMLADDYSLNSNGKKLIVNGYASRAEADIKMRVKIDAASATAPKVRIYYNDELIISIDEPVEFKDVSSVKIGFTSATGSYADYHDVWGITGTATLASELANTGGNLNDYFLLIGTGLAFITGGRFVIKRA